MRLIIGVSLLVAGVAAIDAARGAHWDQFALLCVLAALLLIGLVRSRRTVQPRSDLMNWVEQHAAATDDDPNRVVDRALAAYRAQMLPIVKDSHDDP